MKKIDSKLKYVFLLFLFFVAMCNVNASPVVDGLREAGIGIDEFMNTVEILYLIYFISTFFVVFTVINTSLQKVKNQFQGKPAKVISTIISILVVGAIFYKRTVVEVVDNYNKVGYGIFVLIFVIIAIGYGGYLFVKFKKEKKELLATFLLSCFVFLGTSMLQGIVYKNVLQDGGVEKNLVGGIFSILFGGAFEETLMNVVSITHTLSYIVAFITGVILLFQMFGDKESELGSKKDVKKKPDKKEKDVKRVQDLTKRALSELKELNTEFAGKRDKLLDVRSHLGDLREEKKKGGII